MKQITLNIKEGKFQFFMELIKNLDYLVSEDDVQEVIDNSMIQRVREIQKLSENDQNTIVNVIDAFIRDTKAKQSFGLNK